MPPKPKTKIPKHIELSEDEKTILKNLNASKYKRIGRSYDDELYLAVGFSWGYFGIRDYTIRHMFPNLFKEIAERRRI